MDLTDVAICFSTLFTTITQDSRDSVRTENLLVYFPITYNDVKRTNSTFKSKKCSKVEVSSYIIERCANILAPLVSYLIVLSLNSGEFTKSFKVGKTTPIHESGSIKKLKITDPFPLLLFY